MLVSAGADVAALERLAQLLEVLSQAPAVARMLTVDFGLARGIAYYNGIVFEIRHPGWDGPLGGGGRYDGLARALGSPGNVPALGFAYTLETLLALGSSSESAGAGLPAAVPALVLGEEPESYCSAFRVAQELRALGIPAELEVCGRTLAQGQAYARQRGIKQVLLVGAGGEQTTHHVE